MSNGYTVIVILEAIAERQNELRQALIEIVEPSRQEVGCLEYNLHQDLNNPAKFILYETWKCKESHQQQFEKPYILALAEKIDGLLASSYQIFCAEKI